MKSGFPVKWDGVNVVALADHLGSRNTGHLLNGLVPDGNPLFHINRQDAVWKKLNDIEESFFTFPQGRLDLLSIGYIPAGNNRTNPIFLIDIALSRGFKPDIASFRMPVPIFAFRPLAAFQSVGKHFHHWRHIIRMNVLKYAETNQFFAPAQQNPVRRGYIGVVAIGITHQDNVADTVSDKTIFFFTLPQRLSAQLLLGDTQS